MHRRPFDRVDILFIIGPIVMKVRIDMKMKNEKMKNVHFQTHRNFYIIFS